ncbi:unnamed protein product [Closterium sp. NIES-54]
MAAAKRVLRYLCSTSGMGLVLGGRSPVVLTGHADASWADDQATQRSSQGYTFSLGSGSVSWWSARSSSVLGSSCEAEIYAGAMAAQELRWLTYLLTDLGEQPRSPPVLVWGWRVWGGRCVRSPLLLLLLRLPLLQLPLSASSPEATLSGSPSSLVRQSLVGPLLLPLRVSRRASYSSCPEATISGQVWRRRDYERRGDSGRQLKLLAHGATGATGTQATGATGTLATGATGTRATGVTSSAAKSSGRQATDSRATGATGSRATGATGSRATGATVSRATGAASFKAATPLQVNEVNGHTVNEVNGHTVNEVNAAHGRRSRRRGVAGVCLPLLLLPLRLPLLQLSLRGVVVWESGV